MKICGQQSEFGFYLAKPWFATKTYFDFITVDGGEGGTGAAPLEYSDHVLGCLCECFGFVYGVWNGFDLKRN
jgi:glutamate synthase domain-containing protein 2